MNTNLGEFFMDRKITLSMILIWKTKMSSFRLLLAGLLKFHTETSMHATIQLEFSENSNAHMALENSQNCNLWARARKTEHTHWGPKPHNVNVCSVNLCHCKAPFVLGLSYFGKTTTFSLKWWKNNRYKSIERMGEEIKSTKFFREGEASAVMVFLLSS